ncbi:hypothetical protein [Evansella cellulosilytica]|uniref:Uncharacterized protein n=1 Tax=Evansella cellulosilytica (strain ATCC 21833 / DSM 2522 / FERM P-1141 / JCM 9156 / N-4) TaxID=649639 RepID=E6TZ35_EVAC2|nr:hypothetical protein [Evansella cellulosilytica]ADU32478.1 hypothetical protein Bcell_4251 [Evansella cellulosilytica DSM 2522]
MTQYIYISSPMRLPGGSFGENPVSSEQPNVFNSELDFTHLYFENNYDSNLKRRFSYSPHFSFKHQVAAFSNHIPLTNQIKGTAEQEKCLTILYSYLEEAIQNSGVVEYFTSLNGEEDNPLSKKRNIHWMDLKKPHDLVLEDREFWQITLWNVDDY